MKVEWKSSTNVIGVQSAIVDGALEMLTLSVDSLATLLHPRPGRMLTLVEDLGRFYWAMLRVTELNQALNNVITMDGLVIPAILITMTLE